MASDRQSARNRENFYIKFRKEIFFRTHSLRRDTCFVQLLAFLTKFLSAKVTKFARFCKKRKKNGPGKICNARGRLPWDYGPLINQSERAYYRSHIIKFSNNLRTARQFQPCRRGKVQLGQGFYFAVVFLSKKWGCLILRRSSRGHVACVRPNWTV